MGLMDSFMGPGLFIKLSLDKQGFDEGMGKVKTDLTTWRNETNASAADMAKWGTAIGATVAPILAVGTAIYGLSQKYGAIAQNLKDLNYTTGLTVEKLQQLQWAAVLSGTSFDKVTFGIGQMNLKMEDAADHTTAAYKAFYDLGVNPAGKTPDEVFEEVALALTQIEDPAKRAAIANELYGRSWREMLPFIKEYLEKKKEIQDKPHFSQADLDQFDEMKTGWDEIIKKAENYLGDLILIAYNRPHLGLFENEEPFEAAASHAVSYLELIKKAAEGMAPPIDKDAKSFKELAKEAAAAAEKVESLRDKLEDLYWQQTVGPANTEDLQIQLEEADKLNKQMQEMAKETTEYGGPGIDYEKRQNPNMVDPVTGIPWNDHQYYLKFLEDVRKARNNDELIANKINEANHDQLKTTNAIKDTTLELAKASIEADAKILESLQARVDVTETQYDALAEVEETYWSTQAALAQISYQYVMDSAAEAVNFAGSHPIIQKIVQLSAAGYDIDPSALPVVTAPVLPTADFSRVLTKTPTVTPTESTEAGSTGAGAGGGSTTVINLNQTNYGVPDTGYATNKALGRLAQQKGASGL